MEEMFGKFSDEEIAKTHNTTVNYVRSCRYEKGYNTYKPIEKLLGLFTDKEISEKLNISVQAVIHARQKRGIKPVKKTSKYKDNAEKQRATMYKANYGITLDEYNEMFEKQDGRCAICKEKQNNFLAVDHDHKSGQVRALLCRKCNLMLGFARDNKTILRLAIEYLKKAVQKVDKS